MGFDDSKTEPLIAVGCLSVICGLVAPIVIRFGWWWSLLLLLPVIWMMRDDIWRRKK